MCIRDRRTPFPFKNPRFASSSLDALTLACVRKLTAFEISVSRIAVVVARGLRSAVVDRSVGPTPGATTRDSIAHTDAKPSTLNET